jgi:hypothetical protein
MPVKRSPLAKDAARMRQPMARQDVHALLQSQASIFLGALNELEGRIVALEQVAEGAITGTHTSKGGIVLLDARGTPQ